MTLEWCHYVRPWRFCLVAYTTRWVPLSPWRSSSTRSSSSSLCEPSSTPSRRPATVVAGPVSRSQDPPLTARLSPSDRPSPPQYLASPPPPPSAGPSPRRKSSVPLKRRRNGICSGISLYHLDTVLELLKKQLEGGGGRAPCWSNRCAL